MDIMQKSLKRFPGQFRCPAWASFLLVLCLNLPGRQATAQAKAPRYISIDRKGVMHWVEDGREVTGFGVNYTVPFAHAYRTGKALGVDLKAAIDRDVNHFARLDLDLFRVHVWDTEISDTLGNLLDNEHLDLFDYLLFKLKEHGIRAMITPIAYWGNGWPDPDEWTPGFSHKYGKANCLTDPGALAAQQRYLGQFVSHVNRYTGLAYKDDPDILLFEISNEPHHRGSPEDVHYFINMLSGAIRDAGCIKPVFYNVTHSIQLAETYADSRIDGGTFQWYPTGLGFQKPLQGNMLPNVDDYAIPFDTLFRKKGLARIVYEFDAADMTASYMYPAMARSFRSAGMQLATHFSYDPTYLAPYNTEYNTHYMNLLYAPRKALALMICGEIFRQVPLYADYGRYPANTRFGPFHIDADNDLAEMATADKFYYTNSTTTRPPAPDQLQHIAGWGHSALVEYDGTGAYFLDKLAEGAWLLEVFPDAAVTDNLFGRSNSIDKPRSTVLPERRSMLVDLPGLREFTLLDLMEGAPEQIGPGTSFEILPGKYLLVSPDYTSDDRKMQALINGMSQRPQIGESYPSPAPTLPETTVLVDTFTSCSAGQDLVLKATVVSTFMPAEVTLAFFQHGLLFTLPMHRTHGFQYACTIDGKRLKPGEAGYSISVSDGATYFSFPGNHTDRMVSMEDMDLLYPMTIVKAGTPVNLLDPATDTRRLNRQWSRDIDLRPTGEGSDTWYSLQIRKLLQEDEENAHGIPTPDYSIRHAFVDRIKGRRADVAGAKYLVVECSSPTLRPFQVALVLDNGVAMGTIVKPQAGRKSIRIPLSSLQPVPLPTLPRPYPTFLPYFFPADPAAKLDMNRVEALLLSFGPGLQPGEYKQVLDWEIGRVTLEK